MSDLLLVIHSYRMCVYRIISEINGDFGRNLNFYIPPRVKRPGEDITVGILTRRFG